jgi:hypothetical protein
MKDPAGYLRIPAGFFMSDLVAARKFRHGLCALSHRSAERTTASGILSLRRLLMPPWMEILLNVIGYAGFIGIAKYHKPSNETETETDR